MASIPPVDSPQDRKIKRYDQDDHHCPCLRISCRLASAFFKFSLTAARLASDLDCPPLLPICFIAALTSGSFQFTGNPAIDSLP